MNRAGSRGERPWSGRARTCVAAVFVASLSVAAWAPPARAEKGDAAGPRSRVDWEAIVASNAGAGPGDLEAHLRLAVAYANLGMIPEAASEFQVIGSSGYREFGQEVIARSERLVKEDPGDILSLNMLAFGYYAFDDYAKSARCFEMLVSLEPNNVWVHHYLAYCLSRIGELDRAIEVLKTALALDPSNDYTHLLLGLAYKEKGWYVLSILELARSGRALRELSTLK